MGHYKQFLSEWDTNEAAAARVVQEWLDIQFNPESVIDLGCGAGTFLTLFQYRGIFALGIDAEDTAQEHLTNFMQYDLTQPLIVSKKFDLALCLEVIEHIEQKYERVLINSISNAADVIIFSGAKPGQVGEHHVNCNTKEYWLALFKAKGIELWQEKNEQLKELLKAKEFDTCPWLRENMMLLHRV